MVASVPIGGAGSFSIGVDRDDISNALEGAAAGYARLLVTPGSSVTYTASRGAVTLSDRVMRPRRSCALM